MEPTWISPLYGSAAIIAKTVVKTVNSLSNMLLWGWLPPVEHRAQHDQNISYRNQSENRAGTSSQQSVIVMIALLTTECNLPRAAHFTTVLQSLQRQL
jgi:hypothetical protein